MPLTGRCVRCNKFGTYAYVFKCALCQEIERKEQEQKTAIETPHDGACACGGLIEMDPMKIVQVWDAYRAILNAYEVGIYGYLDDLDEGKVRVVRAVEELFDFLTERRDDCPEFWKDPNEEQEQKDAEV